MKLTKYEVPDAIFPTNNEFDIPVLRTDRMADYLDAPIIKWGVKGRRKTHTGTYHFYTDDYKFTGCWKHPEYLVNSGCPSVMEVNFSINDSMPKALVLALIYKKRWLSRYWQENGVRIFVDLGVSDRYLDINTIGVPKGWRAFSTRHYVGDDEHGILLEAQYKIAEKIRGNDDVLFVVYGSNKELAEVCRQRGWIFLLDYQLAIRQEVLDGR